MKLIKLMMREVKLKMVLLGLTLMVFQLNSQITLKPGEVKLITNENNDTLVVLRVEDVKLLLIDLKDYTIVTQLLGEYEKYKIECDTLTKLQAKEILLLVEKNKNNQLIIDNINSVIKNKDEEIRIKDETIKKQKKEIRKQKILKYLGFTGAIVLPIVTALLILK